MRCVRDRMPSASENGRRSSVEHVLQLRLIHRIYGRRDVVGNDTRAVWIVFRYRTEQQAAHYAIEQYPCQDEDGASPVVVLQQEVREMRIRKRPKATPAHGDTSCYGTFSVKISTDNNDSADKGHTEANAWR